MRPEQYKFDDFVWLPRTVSQSGGHDPLERPRQRFHWLLIRVYRLGCIASHACCLYNLLLRIYEGDSIGNNVSLIIRYATLVTFIINSDTKFATSMLHQQAIIRMYERLATLYPATAKERKAHCVDKYYWSNGFHFLVVFYFCACGFVVLLPLFQSLFTYWSQWMRLGHEQAHFPYLPCYPYMNHVHVPWKYGVIYVIEWLHSTHMVVANMGTDLWMICFVTQLCMHFDYMARSIETYEPQGQQNDKDQEFLAQIVIKHNVLFQLHKELNRIFGGSLILNFLTTAGVLCTVAIYILVQGLGLEALSYVLFIVTAVSQFYLVCYYGELMFKLSTDISSAVYNHPWYNASTAYKKHLLMIIMRSQRPAVLSALGLLPISLETFKQLLTVTYRVFAVVRTMIE